jgi:flagellar L-ring protein FlgH
MKWLLWLMPLSLWAQSGASPGSLYFATGRLADAARDLKATQVDDIVTIVVEDNASAVASGATNTQRKSAAQNNITSLYGPVSVTSRLGNLAGITNNQQIQGQGQTTRNMTISTTISARVVNVLPNGTLVVEATKDIAVNSEKQTITVTGMIRPSDLSPINTVSSNQVADLKIRVNGKGVVGDAVKRPFFLYRILLGLLPF